MYLFNFELMLWFTSVRNRLRQVLQDHGRVDVEGAAGPDDADRQRAVVILFPERVALGHRVGVLRRHGARCVALEFRTPADLCAHQCTTFNFAARLIG